MKDRTGFLAARGISALCFMLMFLSDCRAQGPEGYGMQSSGEAQNFKARQEEKMRQYLERFNQENQAFLPTLAPMGRNEKLKAVKTFISKQYRQNSDFRKKMYEEQRAFLQERFKANPHVQPAMKERMLSRINQSYADMKAFHEGKFREDTAFLDGLIKDISLDGQELNTALQEFFQSQKADARDFLESQQQKSRP